MKYYQVEVYTPFFGEGATVYIAAADDRELDILARRAAFENGAEWYDEEDWLERQEFDKDCDDIDEIEDEYYAQCGYHMPIEITEEEYKTAEADGWECYKEVAR